MHNAIRSAENIIKQVNLEKYIKTVLSKQAPSSSSLENLHFDKTKADELVKSASEFVVQFLAKRNQGKKDKNTRELK